jgi:hypothetical protein
MIDGRAPKGFYVVAGLIVVTVIGLVAAWYGTIAYVVVHFVKKFW